jgi:hypothetical protein
LRQRFRRDAELITRYPAGGTQRIENVVTL